MKIRIFLALSLLTAFFVCSVAAAAGSKEELAKQAVSSDPVASSNAIRGLRAMGQDGLDALFELHARDIKQFAETGNAEAEWTKISHAIDSVAMQKDAYASQLFWYTDFDAALKAADTQNKPILSLRLLGNLNEEFSCANSRFFRALLYSNSEISKFLRENFILHWKSVRPAPKVTIDFGDGRRIERTLTGNSIHYILSEDGEIIDALPGLYSPDGFLGYVSQAREVYRTTRNLAAGPRRDAVLRYRKLQFDRIRSKRNNIVAQSRIKLVERPVEGVTAREVSPLAMAKMVTEYTILTSIADDFSRFEPMVKTSEWEKLAAVYSPGVKFDGASTAFIRRQNKDLSDVDFAKLITKLSQYVALDTTRNDFLLHTQLYARLNRSNGPIDNFNAGVYADLFKTPDSDKWLGLYSGDIYTALDGAGITVPER